MQDWNHMFELPRIHVFSPNSTGTTKCRVRGYILIWFRGLLLTYNPAVVGDDLQVLLAENYMSHMTSLGPAPCSTHADSLAYCDS